MKRKTIGLAMFAAAMLGLAASAGAVDGTIDINMAVVNQGGASPCGSTAGFPCIISAHGSYRLTGNLVVAGATDAIDVNVGQVTIDLNGFSITGPGSSSGTPIGINAGTNTQVTLENGTITGFGTGVTTGSISIVKNVHADNNAFGINAGNNSVVEGCTANNNSAIGIVGHAGCVISGNAANGNTTNGIDCLGSGCLISGNTIVGANLGIGANDATTGYGGNVLQNTTNVSNGTSMKNNVCTTGGTSSTC